MRLSLLLLALAGCCLEEIDGQKIDTCLEVVEQPAPDVGPKLAFAANPFFYDDGGRSPYAELSSLSGQTISGIKIAIQFASPDSGIIPRPPEFEEILSSPVSSTIQQFDGQEPPGRGPSEASFSSNRAGDVMTIQFIIYDGGQVCTALNEPCGQHGACCLGLSCQGTDAGCACWYAWPQ